MLTKHYIPYANERINNLRELLKKYNIEETNSNKIDLLITQAKESLVKNNPITPIKKTLKLLGTIIIPIILAIAQKISESATIGELITISVPIIIITICVFSILYAIFPAIKYLCYRDYSIFCDLIYDLKQIKIFYANNN